MYRRWQPSAGLSWWITPAFELGLGYRFIRSEAVHDDPAGVTRVDTHRVALALVFRLG